MLNPMLNSGKQLFGPFPMSSSRLAAMRTIIARDITHFENLDLLSLDRLELAQTIKSAATAKAMQGALTDETFAAIQNVAVLQGGGLTWPEALAVLLNVRPDIGSVRLNLMNKT